MTKTETRSTLRARRAEASSLEKNKDAGARLRDVFLANLSLHKDLLISSYIPTDNEVDPAPLVAALFDRGYKLCLPCEGEKRSPLTFRAYSADDVLRMGSWHIPEPALTAPIVVPDVLLVPLVGFDRKGYRLGRGGGFYDYTLQALRARKKVLAIGLAFDEQEVPAIPLQPHDQPLDAIVTQTTCFQAATAF